MFPVLSHTSQEKPTERSDTLPASSLNPFSVLLLPQIFLSLHPFLNPHPIPSARRNPKACCCP